MPWLLKMTLSVAVPMIIAHCYIGWRAGGVMHKKQLYLWRYFLLLFLLSFYIYPLYGLLYYIFWNAPNILTLWKPMDYWFWFGFIFSIHLFSWLLVLDLIRFTGSYFSALDRSKMDGWYSWIFGLLAGVLLVVTAIKMNRDTTDIQIKKISYHSPKVPHEFNHFRIVHISDIHGDEYTGQKEIAGYVKKINALHPDLVIFTGDLISYGTDFITMAATELGRAHATCGTYAVIGDHDYWAGASNVQKALEKHGVEVLRDHNVFIRTQSDSLLLTGITEVYSKHIPEDSLRLLTQKYPSAPFRIMATHQATEKVIDQAKKAKYQLLIGGHTHGGQLRIPFLFMTFSAAELDTPYLSGNFRFKSMLMNINNGLGFTLAPVRYNAPPAISVIDLIRGS